MDKIEVSKHTKYSLELIFSESDKMAESITKSLSENVNKSFVAFAIYAWIFSFSFVKVAEGELSYVIACVGCVVSSIFLYKNIFPETVIFRGARPELMFDSYFDDFSGEDLDKEYLATQVENYNDAISENMETITKQVKRFNRSVVALIVFLILLLVALYFPVECLHA
jgi:hypothetical protein